MKLFEVQGECKWMIVEDTGGKNTHMTHIEDLVFYQGYQGVKKAINHLAQTAEMLAGTSEAGRISVKWDGKPAVIAGNDPKDGKFFVGTKSVFNATPLLNKTPADIRKNHGKIPGLAHKLNIALKHLRKLNFDGILQGDIMFTKGDLTTEDIDGESYVVFKPNEIAYAVPAGSDLAKELLAAEIGVVWHTLYSGGPEMSDLTASFGAAAPVGNKNVWSQDADYRDLTGRATMTGRETAQVANGLDKLQGILQKINANRFNTLMNNEEFREHIEPFVNSKIRADRPQVGNANAFLKEFIDYYDSKKQAEIDKLKDGGASDKTASGWSPAAEARINKIEATRAFIEDNSNTLLAILAVYKQIIQVKSILMKKLNEIEGIQAFYKTDDGYEVAGPEGFVAIDHIGGAVKLINRLEFSRRNFLASG